MIKGHSSQAPNSSQDDPDQTRQQQHQNQQPQHREQQPMTFQQNHDIGLIDADADEKRDVEKSIALEQLRDAMVLVEPGENPD